MVPAILFVPFEMVVLIAVAFPMICLDVNTCYKGYFTPHIVILGRGRG